MLVSGMLVSMLVSGTRPKEKKPDSHFAVHLFSSKLKRKEELDLAIKENCGCAVYPSGSDLATREDSSRRIGNFQIKGDALDERIPLIGWETSFPPFPPESKKLGLWGSYNEVGKMEAKRNKKEKTRNVRQHLG